MLTKLSVNNPKKWYKHVSAIQKWINASQHQSTSVSPFEAMFGVRMRHSEDLRLAELLEEIRVCQFNDQRSSIRAKARHAIEKAQEEQRRFYNLRARKAPEYVIGDLVAIMRTQFSAGKKHVTKFLGPYKIIGVKGRDRYEVEKVEGDGPRKTLTAASHMKKIDVNSGAEFESGKAECKMMK